MSETTYIVIYMNDFISNNTKYLVNSVFMITSYRLKISNNQPYYFHPVLILLDEKEMSSKNTIVRDTMCIMCTIEWSIVTHTHIYILMF